MRSRVLLLHVRCLSSCMIYDSIACNNSSLSRCWNIECYTKISLLLFLIILSLIILCRINSLDNKGLFCNLDRISSCLPNLIYRIRQGYKNNFWHFYIAIQYKSVWKPFFDIRIKYSLTVYIRPSCQFFFSFSSLFYSQTLRWQKESIPLYSSFKAHCYSGLAKKMW